jgi:hypothetical protein
MLRLNGRQWPSGDQFRSDKSWPGGGSHDAHGFFAAGTHQPDLPIAGGQPADKKFGSAREPAQSSSTGAKARRQWYAVDLTRVEEPDVNALQIRIGQLLSVGRDGGSVDRIVVRIGSYLGLTRSGTPTVECVRRATMIPVSVAAPKAAANSSRSENRPEPGRPSVLKPP